MYRKGDRVTLSISPSIQLAPYTHLKPHASVSREIDSDDPEEAARQVRSAEADLKKLVCQAMLIELDVFTEMHEAVAAGTEGLIAYCRKELNHAVDQGHSSRNDRGASPGKASAEGGAQAQAEVRRATGPARKPPARK